MTWVLDLDGVIWLGDAPIPGAAEAVGRLRKAGHSVLFTTNNSVPTVAEYVKKLSKIGIAASHTEIVTSAQAAATIVPAGETALVAGGEGLIEALSNKRVEVIGAHQFTDHPDGYLDDPRRTKVRYVIVGWHSYYGVASVAVAASSVKDGALLIGTNDDASYPTPGLHLPGSGAIISAVSVMSGSEPVFAGKPHDPIVTLLSPRLSGDDTVIGDRPSTDGMLARKIGARFGLVLSGVTSSFGDLHPRDPKPDLVAASLFDLVVAET